MGVLRQEKAILRLALKSKCASVIGVMNGVYGGRYGEERRTIADVIPVAIYHGQLSSFLQDLFYPSHVRANRIARGKEISYDDVGDSGHIDWDAEIFLNPGLIKEGRGCGWRKWIRCEGSEIMGRMLRDVRKWKCYG